MGKQIDILEVVNSSGFPFQMAVTDFVRRTKQLHKCRVLFSEHSWKDSAGEYSGFIDLVVASDIFPYVFVIECKRHLGGIWVFLKAEGTTGTRRHAKLLANIIDRQQGRISRSRWVDAPLSPASVESTYCVVPRQDKDNPMLERIGSTLVQSTECLAREDDMRVLATSHNECLYVSVVVTNASLVVAEFKPENVDLESGMLEDGAKVKTQDVPFLRFRKQLSFLKPEDDRKIFENNEYRLDYAKERTVFVVQAKFLDEFLQQFQVDIGWRETLR
jgi:hypothetical protein